MLTTVASITASPGESIAPFTTGIVIHVNPGAIPGVYTFKLRIVDVTVNALLGLESITLIIVKRGVPKTIAKHHQRIKALYSAGGAQVVVWYLLTHIFKDGATFTQIKHAYEVVIERKASNGTIGKILERMKRKRIVVEKQGGLRRQCEGIRCSTQ